MEAGAEMAVETTDPNSSPSPHDAKAKACTNCHTTKTQQALGLPADPQHPKKAAADPHHKKKKKDKIKEEENKKGKDHHSSKDKDKISKAEEKKDQQQVTMELRIIGFGKEVILEQQQRRNKGWMSEEERAVILLVALSSGVIYAQS
ncbi:hypothetical protein BS78_03G420700 [Paspalum vaginatum]|nr:hypothetical protein BS78_03G420700 [Paspalum vaginatum]